MKKRLPQFEIVPASGRCVCRRRGTLLVEMVICTIMLSVVTAILVPGIHAINAQRKATRFETLALIELNSIAAQMPFADDPAGVQLSPSFMRRYSNASLAVEPGEVDEASLQPLKLTIQRPNGESKPALSRTLSVWVTKTETPEKKEPGE